MFRISGWPDDPAFFMFGSSRISEKAGYSVTIFGHAY